MHNPPFPGWLRILFFFIIWIPVSLLLSLFAEGTAVQIFETSPKIILMERELYRLSFNIIATIGCVWIARRFFDKASFFSLGFQKQYKDIILGILTGLLVMSIAYFVLTTLNSIQFKSITFNLSALLYSMIFFIGVAVLEEVLCRGYILSNLMLSTNKYIALFISSVLFAGLHSFNPNMAFLPFFNLFLAGILLGISYIYTKNLWFPIALHFSWNFFQGSIFGFEVSGQNFYTLVQQETVEETIWNGGNFGFEGSLLASFLIVTCIFFAKEYYKKASKDS